MWLVPPCEVLEISAEPLPVKVCASGCLLMNLMVPPSELAPYSVPCGPRSTSTRSMSKKRGSAVPWL